ncbi:MAG: ORF6N domain-containing protein [Ignavibacteriales bacterium]|nr:ORF6N domain-containing protein [Ignavibacteriales bacterium]
MKQILKQENIVQIIYLIRAEKVILDFDLALLYGVENRVLKQSVRRNLSRFPSDFLFQLNKIEWNELITNCDNLKKYKFSPATPFAFTEQGVAMLSSILRSSKAIKVNIEIMRAFISLRRLIDTNKEFASKLKEIEHRIFKHDEQIATVFEILKELMTPPEPERNRIGF